MSANETLRTARRLRYRRLRRPVQKRGVSPVVATLILILIAVAAAAALYLWLVGWQGSVTGTIGKPGVNTGTFTIGGSTSVYPFSQLAVTQYLQNNTGATISLTQGGTGAGMLAVCSGSIDVGEASSVQTTSGLIANDGCPSADVSSITVTTVAYDAVDLAVQNANPHGLISMSAQTLLYIYCEQSSTLPATGLCPTVFEAGDAAVTFPTADTPVPVSTAPTTDLGFAWDNIPAAVDGTVVGTVTQAQAVSTDAYALAACGTNDICATGGTTGTFNVPCGYLICAGPYSSTYTGAVTQKTTTGVASSQIITVQRSDTSGTTQAFTAKMLGIKGSSVVSSYSALAADSSGCGSDGQLGSCNIAAVVGENGNPAVISYVATTPDALGYASDGLTRAATSGVSCEGVATGKCPIGFESIGQTAAVQPSLTSTGTIAAGISDPTGSGTPNSEYAPWRPFEYVTLAPPTGLVASYITWLLQPGVNTAIASESAEVSIYSI